MTQHITSLRSLIADPSGYADRLDEAATTYVVDDNKKLVGVFGEDIDWTALACYMGRQETRDELGVEMPDGQQLMYHAHRWFMGMLDAKIKRLVTHVSEHPNDDVAYRRLKLLTEILLLDFQSFRYAMTNYLAREGEPVDFEDAPDQLEQHVEAAGE